MEETKNSFSLINMPAISIADSEPPRKSRRIILGIILAALLVGVIGTTAAFWTRILDPKWNPFRPEPEEVIEEMIIKMRNLNSLHSENKIALELKSSEAGGGKFFMAFQEDSDVKNKKAKTSFNFSLTVLVMGIEVNFPLQGETIKIGDEAYFLISKLPSELLTPFIFMLGVDLEGIEGNWFLISKNSFENYYQKNLGQNIPSAPPLTEDLQKELQEKIKWIFEKRRLYTVQELDDETIGEKKAYHYLVSLKKEELTTVLAEIFNVYINSIIQITGPFKPGENLKEEAGREMEKEITAFLDKIGPLDFNLWIGKKDKLLYKFDFKKEIDAGKLDKYAEGRLTIDISGSYSQFNKPVQIESPKESKEIEELLEKLLRPFLEDAKNKADSAKIQADMSQLRDLGELMFAKEGSYRNFVCQQSNSRDFGQELRLVCQDIENLAGVRPTIRKNKSNTKYCAYVQLPSRLSKPAQYACVESDLRVTTALDPGTKGHCDGKSFSCPLLRVK